MAKKFFDVAHITGPLTDIYGPGDMPLLSIMHRGRELGPEDLRWVEKLETYHVKNTRDHLPRQTLQLADYQVGLASWRFIRKSTVRMQREEINLAEWRRLVLSSFFRYSYGSVGVWRGGLDGSFPEWEENLKTGAYILARQHAARCVVAELCGDIIATSPGTFVYAEGPEQIRLRLLSMMNEYQGESNTYFDAVWEYESELLEIWCKEDEEEAQKPDDDLARAAGIYRPTEAPKAAGGVSHDPGH